MIAKLDEEAATGDSERRSAAAATRDYLTARADGKATALGVDKTLARCATSPDLDLRKFAALALTFWEGTPEENERIEQTLMQLSDAARFPDDADRVKVREVRYQASMAMARRGSKKTADRFPVFLEMLDEDSLAQIFRVKDKDTPDTAIIGTIMIDAAKSIAELHKKSDLDLSPLLPSLEAMAKHKNPAVRLAAETTLQELKR